MISPGTWPPPVRGLAKVQERVQTSWRRRSDRSANAGDKRTNDKSGSSLRDNAEKIEAWEDEGGKTGSVSLDVLRMLIVDNDMRSADSLELMLRSAGYPETTVAYSAHAALALAVEFRPDIAFLEMNLIDMDSAGRDTARNAGFERYLLKPIAAADLTKLLATPSRSGSVPRG